MQRTYNRFSGKLTNTCIKSFKIQNIMIYCKFSVNSEIKGRFLKFRRYHNFANLFS